jgi:O-methyltransferase
MDPSYLNLLKRCLTASIYEESAWRIVEGPMVSETGLAAALKRTIIAALNRRGLKLIRTSRLDPDARDQGLDWPLFGMTMAGSRRLENIQECTETCVAENIPGDFAETGVWRGGSCILAKAIFRELGADNRRVWCCDSFQGMPKPNEKDLSISEVSDFSDRNFLAATVEEVAANFRKFDLLDDNVKFVKGWFNETLPSVPIDSIAVLRMDGDLYQSTMDALANLYDKVSPSGFIIVDDYRSWEGCRQAVDEFREERAIVDKIINIDAHAIFWRKDLGT